MARLAAQKVDYILIGGVNFLIRHLPELTFDVGIWVRDTPENLNALNHSLETLGASWGPTERDWAPIPRKADWLQQQAVFCLTTNYGALDIFREVRGLEGQYAECLARSSRIKLPGGVEFNSLSDQDMLACQLALPESERKQKRVEVLTKAIKENGPNGKQ